MIQACISRQSHAASATGTIRHGWLESKSEVSESVHAYYDELIVQDQLVFNGDCLVVPAALCKEMMAAVHALHIGIEGCIRRV